MIEINLLFQVNGITTASLHAAPIMKINSDDDQLTKGEISV